MEQQTSIKQPASTLKTESRKNIPDTIYYAHEVSISNRICNEITRMLDEHDKYENSFLKKKQLRETLFALGLAYNPFPIIEKEQVFLSSAGNQIGAQ